MIMHNSGCGDEPNRLSSHAINRLSLVLILVGLLDELALLIVCLMPTEFLNKGSEGRHDHLPGWLCFDLVFSINLVPGMVVVLDEHKERQLPEVDPP